MKDWRLQGQEKYLTGVKLEKRSYRQYHENWDHDHCEFCGKKFSESGTKDLREGYVTMDNYHWICDRCFKDFADKFCWKRR